MTPTSMPPAEAIAEAGYTNGRAGLHCCFANICSAGGRQRLVDEVARRIAANQDGRPARAGTSLGPLINERQRDRVEGFVRRAVPTPEPSWLPAARRRRRRLFYEPTLIAGARRPTRRPARSVRPRGLRDPLRRSRRGSRLGYDSEYASPRGLTRGHRQAGKIEARLQYA